MATVSQPLNTAWQQCVAWVEQVLRPIGFLQYGPSTAAEYATSSGAGSLVAQGWTQIKNTAAAAGDIVVFQPGTLGVDASTGHIGLVSGVSSSGGVEFTQANAPEGAGASVGHLTGSQLTTSGVSIWAPPAKLASDAASLAENASSQLGGAPNAFDPLGSAPLSAVQVDSSTSSAGGPSLSVMQGGCQSLTDILASNAHGSSIPVVGGVIGAVTGTALAPVAIIEWAAQPCVRWKVVLFGGAAVVGVIAVFMLLKHNPVDDVKKAVPLAAAA